MANGTGKNSANTGIRMVPRPNPENSVSAETRHATTPMGIISMVIAVLSHMTHRQQIEGLPPTSERATSLLRQWQAPPAYKRASCSLCRAVRFLQSLRACSAILRLQAKGQLHLQAAHRGNLRRSLHRSPRLAAFPSSTKTPTRRPAHPACPWHENSPP